MTDNQKLNIIVKHTEMVYNNVKNLCNKLFQMETLPFEMTSEDILRLMYLGKVHDSDKFTGFIFNHLWKGDKYFEDALKRHQEKNQHHPEFWGGVNEMPTLYIAEMVCDCLARSQEFGTDIRNWFSEVASVKYNYEKTSIFMKKVSVFLDIILSEKF